MREGSQATGRAGDLGGHQEERSAGKPQECGKKYRPQGEPQQVKTHDFPDPELGKAVPYGVYDIHGNEAGVSVGISHDTAEFAVGAIRRWWKKLGRQRYRRAKRLLVTADSGGSNSSRNRLWKVELQKWADETDRRSRPLPAWHEQMEQDRASAVLPHHAELGWAASGDLGDRGGIDQRNDHRDGLGSSRLARRRPVPERPKSQ